MVSDFMLLSLILMGIGAYAFVNGFSRMREKRLIESMPTSKIRSIAMGLVEVYGKVLSFKELIKSPLSGSDCVYYKYAIEEHRRSGKNSSWVVVDSGSDSTHFFLKDETGKVLVNPKQAWIEIPRDFYFETGWGKKIPKALEKFLAERRINHKAFLGFNKTMRFTEHYLAPGDKLYIIGTAGDNPFVEEGKGTKNEEDIMIQKGKGFYYISDKDEKKVLSSFKWKVIGGLYGGAALITVGLWMLLLTLNLL